MVMRMALPFRLGLKKKGRRPASERRPNGCEAAVCRVALRDLDRVDGGLAAARIVRGVERHLLTLVEAMDAGALERGGVDEHVLVAVVRRDEAEAFLSVVE